MKWFRFTEKRKKLKKATNKQNKTKIQNYKITGLHNSLHQAFGDFIHKGNVRIFGPEAKFIDYLLTALFVKVRPDRRLWLLLVQISMSQNARKSLHLQTTVFYRDLAILSSVVILNEDVCRRWMGRVRLVSHSTKPYNEVNFPDD